MFLAATLTGEPKPAIDAEARRLLEKLLEYRELVLVAFPSMDPGRIAGVECFHYLIEASHDLLLGAREESEADVDWVALQDALLYVSKSSERLMKLELIGESEAQKAPVLAVLAHLAPGTGLRLDYVFASFCRCLDVKGVSKGSIMEVLLGEDHDFSELFRADGQGILQLQEQLIAAQPAVERPMKRRRKNTEIRVSYWKVSLAYVLSQLAYDALERQPFEFSLQELADKAQSLARPFGLHSSFLFEAAHAFFLLDLLVVDPPRKLPEGLSLEYVTQKLLHPQ
jgi:hypothetical protein